MFFLLLLSFFLGRFASKVLQAMGLATSTGGSGIFNASSNLSVAGLVVLFLMMPSLVGLVGQIWSALFQKSTLTPTEIGLGAIVGFIAAGDSFFGMISLIAIPIIKFFGNEQSSVPFVGSILRFLNKGVAMIGNYYGRLNIFQYFSRGLTIPNNVTRNLYY